VEFELSEHAKFQLEQRQIKIEWLHQTLSNPDRQIVGADSYGIAKHTKVDMIWVAGRSPTLVSQNLKATTLTYLAIIPTTSSELENLNLAGYGLWLILVMIPKKLLLSFLIGG
jgi:hypothetical protein